MSPKLEVMRTIIRLCIGCAAASAFGYTVFIKTTPLCSQTTQVKRQYDQNNHLSRRLQFGMSTWLAHFSLYTGDRQHYVKRWTTSILQVLAENVSTSRSISTRFAVEQNLVYNRDQFIHNMEHCCGKLLDDKTTPEGLSTNQTKIAKDLPAIFDLMDFTLQTNQLTPL
ncbi:MAG: hypothetical protein OXT67_10720 [Zetaproteobacteria bacterium]|nr:hypothetical protein [Zetaproteobacteria bacterium]